MRSVVLIPTYNNVRTISSIVRRLVELGLHVIVVDDGSTDKSGKFAHVAGATVLRFKRNRGKGAALTAGFGYVKEHYPEADYIVTMDADGQHDPDDIPRLLDVVKDERAFVIGSRVETPEEMPRLRRLANGAASRLISKCLGTELKDTQSGLRLFPKALIEGKPFSQKKYAIETEMLFRASRMGLRFAEIPIKAVYYDKKQIAPSKDIANVLSILWVVMREYVRTLFMDRRRITKVVLPRLIALLLPALFLAFAVMQVNGAFDKLFGTTPHPSSLDPQDADYEAALTWLKNNSPSDATVIAGRYDGNWIAALADRRIVTSSKVYPSEAHDVAERYRDTDAFFFALDEVSAQKIVDKYNVDYVAIRDDFTYSGCETTDTCHLKAGGNLTPLGMRSTMIGKFLSRQPLKNYEQIWDSPHTKIYRVLNGRTTRNPCNLNEDEKYEVLKIAHEGVESLFDPTISPPEGMLPQKCAVDASILVDGRTRGSIIVFDKPLDRAVFESARDSARDSRFAPIEKNELPEVRFEVSVFDPQEWVPVSIREFMDDRIDTERVYMLTDGSSRGFFLPVVFNGEPFAGPRDFLAGLCGKAHLAKDCYQDADARLYSATAQLFAESASGQIVDMDAAIPVLPEVHAFTGELLRERAELARSWMLSLQRPGGTLRAGLDPFDLAQEPSKSRELVLDPGETLSLLEFAKVRPDARTVPLGREKTTQWESRIMSGEERSTAELVYAGLMNLAMGEITLESAFIDRAFSYANMLRQITNDKALATSFSVDKNGIAHSVDASDNPFVKKTALYFIARLLHTGDDKQLRDLMTQWKDSLRDTFHEERITEGSSLSLAEQAWLVDAFKETAEVTHDRADAEFALEVADFLLDYQVRDQGLHMRGAFWNTPSDPYIYTRGTGKIAEALADAAVVAWEFGYEPAKYIEGYRETTRWIMTMQYTPQTSYFVPTENVPEMTGAIRAALADTTAPIDSAGHFITSVATYIKFMQGR